MSFKIRAHIIKYKIRSNMIETTLLITVLFLTTLLVIGNTSTRKADYIIPDCIEMQAEEHRPMYMKNWINILDDFLRISRKDILTHAGKISAKLAKEKADKEYDKFKERTKNELSPVEIHFLENFEREQKKLLGGKDNSDSEER